MRKLLTVDTITDEQIRELQDESRYAGPDDATYLYCRIALGTMAGDRAKARARCVEILNARRQLSREVR